MRIVCLIGFLTILTSLSSPIYAELVSGLEARPINDSCIAPSRPVQGSVIGSESFSASLGFSSPVSIRYTTEAAPVWYIADRRGFIRRYEKPGTERLQETGVFLDLSDRIALTFPNDNANEMGLLGFELHPDFVTNGFIYIYYSAFSEMPGSTHEARLSRFKSPDGGETIDLDSEEVLIRLDHSYNAHHWGGNLEFGPDGFLYLSLGDFGETENGQNTFTLPGSILRIDVLGGFPYLIPPTNPFSDGVGGAPEIYAWGVRNPWRGSFDYLTGDLWIGDVGANEWEEIDRVELGGNYGWPYREGSSCRIAPECDTTPGLIDPIVEYPHQDGSNAVIGGYVYNGSKVPSLVGTYIFGDVSTGDVFGIMYDSSGEPYIELLYNIGKNIFSFGEGPNQELFVLRLNKVEEIVQGDVPTENNFPQLLSETGCVSAADPKIASDGLIPYEVIAPLWSDGAKKNRWIAMPDWLGPDSKITVEEDGDLSFPVGTVLMKSFAIKGKLVETRLFIRHEDGEWAGYSYEWLEDQTDAVLLSGAKNKIVDGVNWSYPSQAQCLQCHTEAAGRTLGPELQQLNKGHLYESTGIKANQLWTMDKVGLFSPELNTVPADLPRLLAPGKVSGALGRRSRSWLHSNCSHCHRPGGIGQGPMDFRYQDDPLLMNAINVLPTEGDMGLTEPMIISPGKPENSILLERIGMRGAGQMPPLGTHIIHGKIFELIENWITRGIGMGVPDTEKDGWADNIDNCPDTFNPDQSDVDENGIGDVCQ